MFKSDLIHGNTSLQDKLQTLYTLNRTHTIDLSFRPPYLNLLKALGNPHLQLPPSIHVAGTNGKGSTIAFMRAILEKSGYNVHTYTSPHLIEFNERIVLSGKNISDQELEPIIDEVLSHNNNNPVTFFEITTAIAFAAFARNPADILLLETGLGGRLDCTNVIKNPIATIITQIGMDHQEFLGTTIENIAAEKAGIIKENTPCIIAPQTHTPAISTLKTIANSKNAALHIAGSDWFIERDDDPQNEPFRFLFGNKSYRCASLGLTGPHQSQNAATAIAALQVIAPQFPVSDTAITQGLASANWPARLQNITRFFDIPQDSEIWLDGGHNPEAATALSEQCQIWDKTDPKPLHIITAMMDHKEKSGFIETLKPRAQKIHQTFIPGEQKPQYPHWQEIINTLTKTASTSSPVRILICGSLYLSGDILRATSHNKPHVGSV
jgi:dihydrofolate synthase/folylpolyglutamate synthase